MKKSFLFGIVLSLVLAANWPSKALAAACPLRTEVPYRSWTRNSVFFVTADCRRQPIRNPAVYFSYFESWNDVRFTSDALLYSIPRHSLDFLPWGPRRDYGNGSVIKVVTKETVYIVSAGRLYPIGNEYVFNHLHLEWSWIEDVAPEVLHMFPLRPTLEAESDYPEQFAFKYAASSTVYTIEQTADFHAIKRRVPTFDVLQSFYRTDRIAVFPDDQTYLDTGAAAAAIPYPPAPPASLRLVGQTPSSVTIGWYDKSINESQFVIERQDTTSQVDFAPYRVVPANTTLYTDTDVLVNHDYLYRVRAVNAGGSSYVSSVIQASVR